MSLTEVSLYAGLGLSLHLVICFGLIAALWAGEGLSWGLLLPGGGAASERRKP